MVSDDAMPADVYASGTFHVKFHSSGCFFDEFASEREADARRVNFRRGHLIEKRREGVIVVAVDKGDVKFVFVDVFYKIQPGKTSAEHYYAGL